MNLNEGWGYIGMVGGKKKNGEIYIINLLIKKFPKSGLIKAFIVKTKYARVKG